MAGTYTDISLVAPSSAKAGDIVAVEAQITNIHDYILVVYAGGAVDGTTLDFGFPLILEAGETGSSYASFTMPNRDVVVSVESWVGEIIDDTAEKAIALEVVAPPVAGAITKKELDYQNIWQELPLYDIPVGTRIRVRNWGRNDTSINQKMGIYWFVADPEGYVAQEHYDWETFWTGPGLEQGFVGSGFDLSKVGKYSIWVELLMNPDDPQIVDRYIGDLCTVAAVVPESEFRGFGVTEYNRV